MNEGFCLILLAVENTCQAPLAAIDRPFSTYFIGACMRRFLQKLVLELAGSGLLTSVGAVVPGFPARRSRHHTRCANESGHFSADWRFAAVGGRQGKSNGIPDKIALVC